MPSFDLAIKVVGYVAVDVANPVGMEIDGALIRDHHRNGIA